MKTLFLVNLKAGQLKKTWQELEAQLPKWVSDYKIVFTESVADVQTTLNEAVADGFKRIVSVGGDGTNKYVVTAIMHYQKIHPEHELIFAGIPAGTGRDFARATNIPLKLIPAAEYVLTQATEHKVDVGYVEFAGQSEYYLNASSLGISLDVGQRTGRYSKKPWTFITSIISSLAFYKPERISLELDGEHWFEGNVYIASIVNGTSFGQGILIAPDAKYDDGLFDVVVVEEMSTLSLIRNFHTLYTGEHIHHPKVQVKKAKKVRIITPEDAPIGIDFDGEPFDRVREVHYSIIPKALRILL